MEEKTKIELIKEFIETCPLLKNGKINVDYLKDKPQSYSIDRVPVKPLVKPFTDGGGIMQIAFDFTVTAPISSQAIVNLANSKFCEDFQGWIKEQNRQRILPKIKGVQEIKCTSPGYLLQKTETMAIYIIQMNCEYYEA